MNKPKAADGAAGARRAAAQLGIAICAETSHSTMDEDAAKVDVKLSFRHAFDKNKLLTFHCQVKSGESYKAASSDNELLKLKIDKETIDALSNGSSLIVWVPPKPSQRIYWHTRSARSTRHTSVQIPRTQYVRPSLRYDLTRNLEHAHWAPDLPMLMVKKRTESDLIKLAKEQYGILKHAERQHPLVGTLKVSRLAWRHVTRRSKAKSKRLISLCVVPYLHNFLNKSPNRFLVTSPTIKKQMSQTIETRNILCWYRKAFEINGQEHQLLLRIKEEITYPTKWASYPLGVADILQIATLQSWWCKPEK